ncbi:MAG: hypothetical protein Q4B99_02540 [Clostridia bacterium]|nr:hypothetical protein [Clostridia bacterium]
MKLDARHNTVKYTGLRRNRVSNTGPVARFGVVVRDRGARMHRFAKYSGSAIKLIEDAPRFSRYASKRQIARRPVSAPRLTRFPDIRDTAPDPSVGATANLNRFAPTGSTAEATRSRSALPRISKYAPPAVETPPAKKIPRSARFTETSLRATQRSQYVVSRKIDIPFKRIAAYALLAVVLGAVGYVIYFILTGDPTL